MTKNPGAFLSSACNPTPHPGHIVGTIGTNAVPPPSSPSRVAVVRVVVVVERRRTEEIVRGAVTHFTCDGDDDTVTDAPRTAIPRATDGPTPNPAFAFHAATTRDDAASRQNVVARIRQKSASRPFLRMGSGVVPI